MEHAKEDVLIGLRAHLESAPDAALIADRGEIAWINTKLEALFGYSRAELVGKSIETLVPERFRSAHEAHLGSFFLPPRSRRIGSDAVLYGAHKKGWEFPMEVCLGPVETADGVLAWATILDVSARRDLDARLRASLNEKEGLLLRVREQEAFLQKILENLPAAVSCKDSEDEYRFTLVSKQLIGSGFSAAAIGKNAYDLLPFEQADALMRADRRVIETGEIVRISRQVVDNAAGRSVVRITKIPFSVDGKKPRYVLGVSEDITAQDRFEQLRRMQFTVTRELSESGSFDGAIPALLKAVAEGMERDVAILWWIDRTTQTLRLRKAWSSTEGSAAFANDSASFSFARGVGFPGRAWELEAPFMISDASLEPRYLRMEQARQRGMHGAFGLPIIGKAGVLGVLEVLCTRPEEVSLPLMNVLGDVGRQIGQFHDRMVIQEERDRFFSLSLDLMAISVDGHFTRLNPAFESLGYGREELVNRPILDFVHPDDVDATRREIEKVGVPTINFENRFRCKDGSYRWLLWSSAGDAEGRRYATARDITEERRAKALLESHAEEMKALSLTDDLTGLCNRRGFLALGERQLKLAVRGKQPVTLLFMDLDGLKQINDELGHDTGNGALMATAEVLRSTFRDADVLGRIGGDEFVALVLDCESPDLPLGRLARNIKEHNEKTNSRCPISVSTGAAVFDPSNPEGLEMLIQRADLAMYDQKRTRPGRSWRPREHT